MEQYALYQALKKFLSDLINNYSVTFNDMNELKDNSIGVYVSAPEVSNKRELATGKYDNIINRVQFLLMGDLTQGGLIRLLQTASGIRDRLIIQNNQPLPVPPIVQFNTSTNKIEIVQSQSDTHSDISIMLTKVTATSDLVFLGKTSQGRPLYSMNFRMAYGVQTNTASV